METPHESHTLATSTGHKWVFQPTSVTAEDQITVIHDHQSRINKLRLMLRIMVPAEQQQR
jgi:hypothetical protein